MTVVCDCAVPQLEFTRICFSTSFLFFFLRRRPLSFTVFAGLSCHVMSCHAICGKSAESSHSPAFQHEFELISAMLTFPDRVRVRKKIVQRQKAKSPKVRRTRKPINMASVVLERLLLCLCSWVWNPRSFVCPTPAPCCRVNHTSRGLRWRPASAIGGRPQVEGSAP